MVIILFLVFLSLELTVIEIYNVYHFGYPIPLRKLVHPVCHESVPVHFDFGILHYTYYTIIFVRIRASVMRKPIAIYRRYLGKCFLQHISNMAFWWMFAISTKINNVKNKNPRTRGFSLKINIPVKSVPKVCLYVIFLTKRKLIFVKIRIHKNISLMIKHKSQETLRKRIQ